MLGVGVGPGYASAPQAEDADPADAIIAAMTSPPDGTRETLIRDTVAALVAGGVWEKLDFLQVYAAHDSQAARVDWIDPSRVATVTGAPTFTTDRGYNCNTTTQHIDTLFVPSVDAEHMTGTAMMIACYERSNVASAGRTMGAAGGGPLLEGISRNASDQVSARLNNATLTALAGSVTDGRGLTGWQREGGSDGEAALEGVVQTPVALAGTLTSALPTVSVFVNARNNSGSAANWRGGDYALAAGGAPLTDAEWLAFNDAIADYMTAVGANV